MEIKTLNIENPKWKAFISDFPAHNIFHSPEMTEVFSKSEGFEAFPLFAIENNEIFACAFPISVKTEFPIASKFTKRLIMYSSPLFRNSEKGIEGINLILNHTKKLAKEKSLFLEIRNSELFPQKDQKVNINNFKYIPYENYLIDLTRGSENIWNSFNTYTRNHIRKNEKKNSVIREIENSELETAINLIYDLYNRKGIPIANKTLFQNAYKLLSPKKLIRTIVLENDSKIAAARITLNYGSTIFDWFAAAAPEYKSIYPNEALVWNTLYWGIENNYKLFDFGGGAVKGKYYGPAKFKEKF